LDKDPETVYPRRILVMDISSVYYNSGLKLEELLNSSDFDFCHDIFGIRDNINRDSTGTLNDRFLPRFAN